MASACVESAPTSVVGDIRPSHLAAAAAATAAAAAAASAVNTRPFTIIVRNEASKPNFARSKAKVSQKFWLQTFTVNADLLRTLSPVFAAMFYGRDFEKGRELLREIVDEKSADIEVFLRCLHKNSSIDGERKF